MVRQELADGQRDPHQPALQLETDPAARYQRFDQVLADVKRAGVTKLGFVNNPPTF